MTNLKSTTTLQNEIAKLQQKIMERQGDVEALQSALDGLLAVQRVEENRLSQDSRQLLQG